MTPRRVLWLVAVLATSAAVLPPGARSASSKPFEWCREDLPGCCPKRIDQILLLHIEKTGGATVRTFLSRAAKRKWPAELSQQKAICSYLEHMPYACNASLSQDMLSVPVDARCNAGQQDYYDTKVATGAHFRQHQCKLTSGHHDWRMIDAIPAKLRPHVMLVTNFREPVSRLISHYDMHVRQKKEEALASAGIDDYLLRVPAGVAMSRNKMTRVLAGTFCCRGGQRTDHAEGALLERALRRLDEFCAVGMTQHMRDTFAYIEHVLGLPRLEDQDGSSDYYNIHRNNHSDHTPVAVSVKAKLREFNGLDDQLYAAAQRRWRQQMGALPAAMRQDVQSRPRP